MTLATYEEVVDAEVVLSDSDAEDFDLRFQYALGGYAEARQELIDCIQFVRGSDVAERLGFKSRGDYIADRVAGLNVKWAVEDRRSLVELMAYDENGGMSTRQIGNALGVSFKTAARDVESVSNDTDEPRKVQSSDGITRTYTTNTEWPEVPAPDQRGDENRDTDLANGARNDMTAFAWRYIDYVKAVGKNMPKENISPAATEHIIKAMRDTLADITAATEVAINKLEGEGK